MSSVLSRVVSVMLRVVLVAAGLVVGVLAVLAGLVLAFWLIVWGLLRGRKPKAVRFRMNASRPFAGTQARPHQGDVVDIEARELPDVPPQQLTRDRG